MKINRLDEEDLKNIYPNCSTISFEELSYKKKKNYLILYNVYRKLFSKYLIRKLNLKKYDKIIEKSKFSFVANESKDMDIYQYFVSPELKFFYIRNNIYIEKLSSKEKNFFIEKIINKNYELDKATIQMIEKTYKKVIMEDKLKNGSSCITLYGPNNERFLAKNDSIILGFNYNKFNESHKKDIYQRQANELKFQRKFFHKVVEKMNEEYKVLSDNIKVIEYDDLSINKHLN